MGLRPEAKAIAELDAICDQYERAIRDGHVDLDDDASSDQSWLQRVAPELRSWLSDELEALRSEFSSSAIDPTQNDSAAWEAVTRCETFRALSRDAKTALAAAFQEREFKPDELLLRSGQRASGLILITAGQVRVVNADKKDRYEIDTDGAGGVVGEMSTLTGYACSADVVATKSVRALVLPLAAFESLRAEHPEIEIALSQLVSDRLGHRTRDALCGKVLSGYRLQQCLGNGAMGVVYQASSDHDGADVALKMLRHRFIYSPAVVSRFDQEAKLLARLHHENIVALRGHFVAYRTRFIVLELFDGADLRQVIRHHGPLSQPVARALLGQIAAGLQYAHAQGVLHLDLKPANILVDRSGRLAITDFGLSRLIESDGYDRESVGTPIYMPPEQFMMANLGPHCDWYSLGCIAYELLVGERLFHSDQSSQFIDQKLNMPTLTRPALENVDEELREVLRAALNPIALERKMDLKMIASWARPVPELASA